MTNSIKITIDVDKKTKQVTVHVKGDKPIDTEEVGSLLLQSAEVILGIKDD